MTHSSEEGETIETIDDKINALNLKELDNVCSLLMTYRTSNNISEDTKQHASAIYDKLKIIKDYRYEYKGNDNKKLSAVSAYLYLKDYYKDEANNTAKGWFKRLNFNYARDTQQS